MPWLHILMHTPREGVPVYTSHLSFMADDRDLGGMRTRAAEPWQHLENQLRNHLHLPEAKIADIKQVLLADPRKPYTIEISDEQANSLGIRLDKHPLA